MMKMDFDEPEKMDFEPCIRMVRDWEYLKKMTPEEIREYCGLPRMARSSLFN